MFFSRLDFRLSHLLSWLYYSICLIVCQDVFYNFLIFFLGYGGVAPPSLHLLLYHFSHLLQALSCFIFIILLLYEYTHFGINIHQNFFEKSLDKYLRGVVYWKTRCLERQRADTKIGHFRPIQCQYSLSRFSSFHT